MLSRALGKSRKSPRVSLNRPNRAVECIPLRSVFIEITLKPIGRGILLVRNQLDESKRSRPARRYSNERAGSGWSRYRRVCAPGALNMYEPGRVMARLVVIPD